ncbi:hypothetical protein LX36DRAFT_173176 [Colletotrichum falcatum]|nr:hypothetical protein LX36DRAFT_173176 [Colletotrichum falcatum]
MPRFEPSRGAGLDVLGGHTWSRSRVVYDSRHQLFIELDPFEAAVTTECCHVAHWVPTIPSMPTREWRDLVRQKRRYNDAYRGPNTVRFPQISKFRKVPKKRTVTAEPRREPHCLKICVWRRRRMAGEGGGNLPFPPLVVDASATTTACHYASRNWSSRGGMHLSRCIAQGTYVSSVPNTGAPWLGTSCILEQLKCAASDAEDPLIASSRLRVSGRRISVLHER